MLVNKNLSQEILDGAGETRKIKAKRYVNEGRVNIIKTDYQNQDNFCLTSIVSGNIDEYKVKIEVKNSELEIASCECQDYQNNYGACKHIVATLMKFEQTKYWDSTYQETQTIENKQNENIKHKYRSFNNLINSFYNEELEEMNLDENVKLLEKDKIKIETKIDYDKFSYGLKLEFKIGSNRMYKIKDLPEFYTRFINNEFFKYGEKLEFVHNRENFTDDSKELLDFILKYAEIMKYSSSNNRYGYYYSVSINKSSITLGENTIDEAFELLKNKKVNFNYEYINTKLEFIEENPKIQFNLSKINEEELSLKPNIDIFKIAIFKGKEYNYVLKENNLHKCDKEFSNSVLKMIRSFRENYTSEMIFRKENLKDFYSVVMPKIENVVYLKGINEKEIENYRPQKLI